MNASPPEIGQDGNSVAGGYYCFLTLFLSLKHPLPPEAQIEQ